MTLLELDILLPVLCLKSSEQRHSSLFSLQICCCVGFFWFAWGCGFSSLWLSKLTAALQNFTGKFKALSCLAWLCSHLIVCWVPPKAWSFLHPWGFCWWFQGQQEESQGRYFHQGWASSSSACSILPTRWFLPPKHVLVHAKAVGFLTSFLNSFSVCTAWLGNLLFWVF